MSDDFRFVHREESFNDLAVRELAFSQAACLCRLQFGRCTQNECLKCSSGNEIKRCYSQMSDYDRLRFKKYTSQEYIKLSAHSQMWMTFSRNIRFFFLSIIFIFAILFIIFLYIKNMPKEKPYVSDEIDSYIIENILYTQNHIYDCNGDGILNCIDYSILFKKNWDLNHPDKKNLCKIIRNKNPVNGFHHLFISVDGIEVEPWASNPYRYLMVENWSFRRYNPVYNIKGETNKWLMKAN